MSATVAQRPVPIRPSPARGLSSKSFVLHTSPSTLTPPRTGIKRKLEEGSPESAKCKRRINFATNYSVSPQQPAAVCRRNARERNRVKQVNNGFATLRQHIPGASKAKKVSKVETLKQAVDYIRTLQTLLDENDYVSQSSNTITTQIPQSNSISAYEYSTQNNMTQMPNKFHYNTFYYSNENVSPVCPSVYSSSHSPGCSDGATDSPSPSYISDTSSQISSPVVIPAPIPDDPTNFLMADTFGGTFGMQYLEDEDFIENCIESWEAK